MILDKNKLYRNTSANNYAPSKDIVKITKLNEQSVYFKVIKNEEFKRRVGEKFRLNFETFINKFNIYCKKSKIKRLN